MRRAVTAFGLFLAVSGPSWAEGPAPATALDSDKVTLNDVTFQFNGLDGVELNQSCYVDGQPWACGAAATRALQTLLEGLMVICTPTGETSGDAAFAVCTSGSQDIGETMVRNGWAMANPTQSDAYVAAEKAARDAREGIWRGLVLAPSVYREDLAAIEKSYLEQASASILADAQAALADAGIDVFSNVHVATFEPAQDVETSDHKVRVGSLSPGFINAAIPAHEVFSWPAVSRVLEEWRQSTVGSVVKSVQSPIWEELIARPHQQEGVTGENDYYRVLRRRAAPMLEQRRQPILLLTQEMLPAWVGKWLNGRPPEGAVVEKKADIVAQAYIGTIDGIDVYRGPTPGRDSVLFPQDILVSAGYRKNADGGILTMDRNSVTAPELFFGYSIALEWKPDEVVWLHYPYEDHE